MELGRALQKCINSFCPCSASPESLQPYLTIICVLHRFALSLHLRLKCIYFGDKSHGAETEERNIHIKGRDQSSLRFPN